MFCVALGFRVVIDARMARFAPRMSRGAAGTGRRRFRSRVDFINPTYLCRPSADSPHKRLLAGAARHPWAAGNRRVRRALFADRRMKTRTIISAVPGGCECAASIMFLLHCRAALQASPWPFSFDRAELFTFPIFTRFRVFALAMGSRCRCGVWAVLAMS